MEENIEKSKNENDRFDKMTGNNDSRDSNRRYEDKKTGYFSRDQNRSSGYEPNKNIATGYKPGGNTSSGYNRNNNNSSNNNSAVNNTATGYKPKNVPDQKPNNNENYQPRSKDPYFKGWGGNMDQPSKTEEQLGTDAWGSDIPDNEKAPNDTWNDTKPLNFSQALGSKASTNANSNTGAKSWGDNMDNKPVVENKGWGNAEKSTDPKPAVKSGWDQPAPNNTGSDAHNKSEPKKENDWAKSNKSPINDWAAQTNSSTDMHNTSISNTNNSNDRAKNESKMSDWASPENDWENSQDLDMSDNKKEDKESRIKSHRSATGGYEHRNENSKFGGGYKPRDQNSSRYNNQHDTRGGYDSNRSGGYRPRDNQNISREGPRSDRNYGRDNSNNNNNISRSNNQYGGYKPRESKDVYEKSERPKYNPALDDLNERGQRKNFDKANVKISSADQLSVANFQKQRRAQANGMSLRGPRSDYRQRQPSERSEARRSGKYW